MATKKRYVWTVYAVFNNKPAGVYGTYRTPTAAREGARGRHMTTRTKRERVSQDIWQKASE